MSLRNMLTGKWFTRLVMISWIICTVSVLVVFRNMELIVHGQLYSYGLIFSPEWADAYRVFTWAIFVCLGVPLALSGLALASSFLKVEELPKRANVVPRKVGPPRGVAKAESQQIRQTQTRQVQQPVEEAQSIRTDIGDCVGILCPECKKVFGRALVMLDFRSGSNRMISVCPYCNHVLGYTSEEKGKNESFHVAPSDKRIVQ